MKISWYGQACFQIITENRKKEKVLIAIDPFSEKVGLRVPKLKADILLITHDHHDHNNKAAVSGTVSSPKPFIIEGPGEYEVRGVFIRGIPAFHDSSQGKERGKITIYIIEAEEISVCHLGDLGQPELIPEQVDKVNNVDILMIPVGGKYTITSKEAFKIISQIEPKITIPMHYSLPRLKAGLASVNQFLKTLGIKSLKPVPNLSVKKKDLSEEEAKIVVLNS
jgi:L-ascorbate metabolism protein UlaG (beta-lactamase superfamily)